MITEPVIDDTVTAYCLYAESVGRYDYRDDELETILYEYRMDAWGIKMTAEDIKKDKRKSYLKVCNIVIKTYGGESRTSR